jgi:adenylate cyclase
MALVNALDEKHGLILSSLLSTSVAIALLLCFVMALNNGMSSFSKSLLRPLRALVDDMSIMSQLDLIYIDREMPEQEEQKMKNRVRVAEELQQLQQSYYHMRAAIKSWSKYVPPAVVQRLFRAGVEAKIGVSRVSVTILFCDIKGFEDKVRGLSPDDLLNVLSEALGRIADVIAQYKGTLLEFIGDEVLAVFNAPSSLKHHRYYGVASALEIHREVSCLSIRCSDGREVQISCRCGVNSCNILAGNIGSTQRMKYGLLGDGINLTARLKSLNTKYSTQTLCSAAVFGEERIDNLVMFRPVDLVAVKGKTEPTTVFEPLCLRKDQLYKELTEDPSEPSSARDRRNLRYKFDSNISALSGRSRSEEERRPTALEMVVEKHLEAFDLYKKREFAKAAALFGDVNTFFTGQQKSDEPSELLRARCLRYCKELPPEDWDGVERLTKK